MLTRSSCEGTKCCNRGSIALYQTSDSYLSTKQSRLPTIFCSSSFSSGSRCWSACAAPGHAKPMASAPTAQATCWRKRQRNLAPWMSRFGLYIGYGVRHRNFRRLGLAPVSIFEISGAQAALADHDAVRNADELRIGELHPGAGVAIVQQYIGARLVELLIQPVGRLAHALGFLIVEGYQDHQKRR